MRVIKDLIGGQKPSTIEVPYNGDLAADSTTKRYIGSIVKVMDFDDIDHGLFYTWGGLATIGEDVCGILEEEQGTTGNYLPDDATYETAYMKMTPCFPSTIVEAEYAQSDAAGTTNLDTGTTGSAAGTALTTTDITATGDMVGGWIYFTNGSCANYLFYVSASDHSAETMTVSALPAAVLTGDDFVAVLPAAAQKCLFDATYTGIKSEVTYGSHSHPILGLSTWITAPGIPKQKLSRAKHNGLYIPGARFYHHFTFAGSDVLPNAWAGVKKS